MVLQASIVGPFNTKFITCIKHRLCRNNRIKCVGAFGDDDFKNLIGIHGSVWVGGSSKEEISQAIQQTSKAGFDLIELPMFNPEEQDGKFIKQELAKYDLSCSMSLGLTPDTDISSEDNEIVQRGVDKLKRVIDIAHEVECKLLVGVLYSAIQKYPGPPSRTNKQNAMKALKELDKYSIDRGVQMGLEVINRYETNLLNNARDGVEFLEEGEFFNIGLHLDTFHMNIEESSMGQAIDIAMDDLIYIHVGESHRGYMGSGTINWKEVFDNLMLCEYDGPITFESFSSQVVSKDLSNNLCVWRNLWDDSMSLAQHARKFIDLHLEAAEMSVKYNGLSLPEL